jgi:hypothetical protein
MLPYLYYQRVLQNVQQLGWQLSHVQQLQQQAAMLATCSQLQ